MSVPSDTGRLDWLEASGFTLARDAYCGAPAWACFIAYPEKPETTACPFPMYATARSAIDAAMTRQPYADTLEADAARLRHNPVLARAYLKAASRARSVPLPTQPPKPKTP